MPGETRQPRFIRHIRNDAGTEFQSDTFKKWCSENKIHFNSAAPKHQEQNGLVERHWGTIAKLANTLLLHARLNRRFFYYAAKYAQYIHGIIPVQDLLDEHGLPTTPYYLATGRKHVVKHFWLFGYPTIFKQYEVSSDGKRIQNKYNQQGLRGIFVGILDDASGWLIFVSSAKISYISVDAVFDESFTSPLVLPDLSYQGSIKLHGTGRQIPNQDAHLEHTDAPTGQEETFLHEDYDMPHPSRNHTISDISDLVSYPKRGNNSALTHVRYTSSTVPSNEGDIKHNLQSISNIDSQVVAYFTTMKNYPDVINNSEYLNIAHGQLKANKTIKKNQDTKINLSDFTPEPRSPTQVLK